MRFFTSATFIMAFGAIAVSAMPNPVSDADAAVPADGDASATELAFINDKYGVTPADADPNAHTLTKRTCGKPCESSKDCTGDSCKDCVGKKKKCITLDGLVTIGETVPICYMLGQCQRGL